MPPNSQPGRNVVRSFDGMAVRYDGGAAEPGAHAIAVETPVNIIYGSLPFAVMMASPADLEDFAYGFSFTEGIIDAADDVRDFVVAETDAGIKVSLTLKAENMQRHLGRARNLAGRSGCGICGISDLSEMPDMPALANHADGYDPAAIARALRKLEEIQTLNAATRSVHGAAFCNWRGEVIALREDVGRHNALDKLVGAMLRSGNSAADGFVLITSRASYEMVEKTVRAGAPVLVAMSAPTSLAIERAQQYGLTLIAVARDDGAIAFTSAISARSRPPRSETGKTPE